MASRDRASPVTTSASPVAPWSRASSTIGMGQVGPAVLVFDPDGITTEVDGLDQRRADPAHGVEDQITRLRCRWRWRARRWPGASWPDGHGRGRGTARALNRCAALGHRPDRQPWSVSGSAGMGGLRSRLGFAQNGQVVVDDLMGRVLLRLTHRSSGPVGGGRGRPASHLGWAPKCDDVLEVGEAGSVPRETVVPATSTSSPSRRKSVLMTTSRPPGRRTSKQPA